MQQQDGSLRQGQLVEQGHEFGLLFLADKKIVGTVIEAGRSVVEFLQQKRFAPLFAPVLQAFLMRNAKKPTAELLVFAQAVQVPGGVDKSLLDKVQAGLFLAEHLKSINV